MQYFSTKLKVRFSGSCLIESAVTCKHGISVNNYIVYEINKTINTTGSDLTLENCLFGEVTLAKNADILIIELDLIEEEMFHFHVVDLVKLY